MSDIIYINRALHELYVLRPSYTLVLHRGSASGDLIVKAIPVRTIAHAGWEIGLTSEGDAALRKLLEAAEQIGFVSGDTSSLLQKLLDAELSIGISSEAETAMQKTMTADGQLGITQDASALLQLLTEADARLGVTATLSGSARQDTALSGEIGMDELLVGGSLDKAAEGALSFGVDSSAVGTMISYVTPEGGAVGLSYAAQVRIVRYRILSEMADAVLGDYSEMELKDVFYITL